MKGLRQALDDYLTLRRGLGYKLERAESFLSDFLNYVEAQGSPFVTTALALEWAILPTDSSASHKAARLGVVRGFSKYLHALDPRTEIPSQELLPHDRKRRTPYIYSGKDIVELIKAATGFRCPLKVRTYTTLISLVAVTGMRIGEAIALERADIDWGDKLLVVRESKFGKSRELPLHPTTIEALRAYTRTREQSFADLRVPSFFVSQPGTRLSSPTVHKNFLACLRRARLSERRPRPRIHDLRHTFAVKTLVGWYKKGLNVDSLLPLLSTYLGHVCPSTTYWYLSASPQLLRLAAQRRKSVRGGLL